MEQRHLLPPGTARRGRLTRDWIVRRLAGPRGARTDVPPGEAPVPAIPAAVLVPLVANGGGFGVLLTRRTPHLSNHAGQVSFPGGRIEADEDAVAAALRETEEEVGLPARRIELVGRLDDYITGTGFRITPLVGIVEAPLDLVADPFEVAEIFEAPLDYILDPANHQRCERMVNGRQRPYHAIPYGTHYIWGATAGILINLCEVLKD